MAAYVIPRFFAQKRMLKSDFVNGIINMRLSRNELKTPMVNYFEGNISEIGVNGLHLPPLDNYDDWIAYRFILCDLIKRYQLNEYLLLIPSSVTVEDDDQTVNRYVVVAIFYDGESEEVFHFSVTDHEHCSDERVFLPAPIVTSICSMLFDSRVLEHLSSDDQEFVSTISNRLAKVAGFVE